MTLTDIIRVTARVTGVTVAQIESRAQRRDWTLARRIAWYVANETYGIAQAEIGRKTRRCHTSVGHACRCLEKRLATDDRLRETLAEVRRALADIDYTPRRLDLDPAKRQRNERSSVLARNPVKIIGSVCSPEWWASNDASFRAGMARAAYDAKRVEQVERMRAFLHMGKSAHDLTVVDAGRKSPLALPRNLCIGLQSPTPDQMIQRG